jgi:glycosyltransferase involved in cell wall biosynthesis
LVLTHDVESAFGVAQCRALMSLHERFGTRASFNFVLEQYLLPPGLREEIIARQFEVGVHGLTHDGKLFRSHERFKGQCGRINAYLKEWGASGFRAPSMHHELEWLLDLDIDYDLSTFDTDPFEPYPKGCQTIFPFRVAGAHGRRGYVELPYTLVQDFTLFVLLKQRNTDLWKRKLDWIAERGGMALLIVHPDYVDFRGDGDGWRTYSSHLIEDFLAYVCDRYAGRFWNALPRDVARHYARMNAGTAAGNTDAGKSLPEPARAGVTWLQTPVGGPADPTPSRDERVCVVRHGYYPSDPRVYKEVRALAEAGYRVDVICLRMNHEPRREIVNGVHVFRLPLTRDRGSVLRYIASYSLSLLSMAGVLSWRCLCTRYACVQVNTMPDALVFATWIARLRGARILLDLHEPCPELFLTKYGPNRLRLLYALQVAIERWAIRYADGVITVNETIRDRFVERGAPRDKIDVVRNVPDERLEASAGKGGPHRGFVLVTHGTMQPRYGHDVILRALPLVRERIPDVHLRVIGTGDTVPQLRALAARLGCLDAVTFTGFVPHDEIAAHLCEADIGLVPLLPSPFAVLCQPNKLFEYAALRIPVVCARFAAIEEVFDGSCVAFFEAGNPADLAARILELHADPIKRQWLVDNAFRRYKRLHWPEARKTYLRCVEGLINTSRVALRHAAPSMEGTPYAG